MGSAPNLKGHYDKMRFHHDLGAHFVEISWGEMYFTSWVLLLC